MKLTPREKKLKAIAEKILEAYDAYKTNTASEWSTTDKDYAIIAKEMARWQKKIDKACGIEETPKKAAEETEVEE